MGESMKASFLLACALLLISGPALSQKASTSIYEQDQESKKTKTFTAKVRLASENSDSWNVYFEGEQNKGVFSLSQKHSEFGLYTNLIEESRKPKGPSLSVTVDEDKNIEKMSKSEAPSHQEPDPNKKWNFGP